MTDIMEQIARLKVKPQGEHAGSPERPAYEQDFWQLIQELEGLRRQPTLAGRQNIGHLLDEVLRIAPDLANRHDPRTGNEYDDSPGTMTRELDDYNDDLIMQDRRRMR